jgi:hypothetical protein
MRVLVRQFVDRQMSVIGCQDGRGLSSRRPGSHLNSQLAQQPRSVATMWNGHGPPHVGRAWADAVVQRRTTGMAWPRMPNAISTRPNKHLSPVSRTLKM